MYHGLASRIATYPIISFELYMARDVNGVGTSRIITNGVWLVRAIGATEAYSALASIADRVDTLMQGASSGGVLGCIREEPFEFEEVIDGVQYRHLGGLYRIFVQ